MLLQQQYQPALILYYLCCATYTCVAEIVSSVFNTAYMVLAKVRGISDQDVLFLCMFNNTFDIKQSHYCAHRNRHSGLRVGFKADVQKQNKTKKLWRVHG